MDIINSILVYVKGIQSVKMCFYVTIKTCLFFLKPFIPVNDYFLFKSICI